VTSQQPGEEALTRSGHSFSICLLMPSKGSDPFFNRLIALSCNETGARSRSLLRSVRHRVRWNRGGGTAAGRGGRVGGWRSRARIVSLHQATSAGEKKKHCNRYGHYDSGHGHGISLAYGSRREGKIAKELYLTGKDVQVSQQVFFSQRARTVNATSDKCNRSCSGHAERHQTRCGRSL
jgi:hypothetical protein